MRSLASNVSQCGKSVWPYKSRIVCYSIRFHARANVGAQSDIKETILFVPNRAANLKPVPPMGK